MSVPVRWLIVFLIVALAVSGHTARKTLPESPNSLQLADEAIAKDRSTRTIKKVQNALGFFGTIKELAVDQANDTKSAYSQLSDLINANFANENDPKPPQSSSQQSASVEDDDGEGTTTLPPPPKITREEFLNIIRRNLIALRRLFDIEWKQAMKDSKNNIREYSQEIKSHMKIKT